MFGALLQKIGAAVSAVLITAASWFSPVQLPSYGDLIALKEELASSQLVAVGGTTDETLFVGAGRFRLNSSIATTDTSLNLVSFRQPVSGVTLSMTDFGSIGYATVEPQTSRVELVSFTTVTQNSDGTATLGGVTRGLQFVSPYTASTTLRQSHPAGSVFVISNPPQLYNRAAFKDNAETISKQWTFSILPIASTQATTSSQLVNKALLDATALVSAPIADLVTRGVVEESAGVQAASSTATDTSGGAPLFLGTRISNWAFTATHTIPVTGITGQLPVWFMPTTTHNGLPILWNTSTAFNGNFGLGTSSPASVPGVNGPWYVTATSSAASIKATSTVTQFGSVTYNWPPSRCTYPNGCEFANDGSNSQRIELLPGPKYFAASTSQLTSAGDTNENTLAGVLIPANTIGINGVIRVSFLAVETPGGGVEYYRVRLGGTAVTAPFSPLGGSTGYARVVAEIANRGSASSQVSNFQAVTSASSTAAAFVPGSLVTTSVNTADDQQLQITCQKAVAGDTCGTEYLYIEILR